MVSLIALNLKNLELQGKLMRVIESFVDELKFERVSENSHIDADETNISLANLRVGFKYKIKTDRDFAIGFDLNIPLAGPRALNIKYNVIFESDDPIDDKFKNSKKVKKEAIEKAFLFLKAFVISFYSSAGFGPIEFPSIQSILSNVEHK